MFKVSHGPHPSLVSLALGQGVRRCLYCAYIVDFLTGDEELSVSMSLPKGEMGNGPFSQPVFFPTV